MQNEKQMFGKPARQPRLSGLLPFFLLLTLPAIGDHRPAAVDPGNLDLRPAAVALEHAHAHNDYLHDKPLREALSRGFTSIEADVHLVNGELYLGHWFPRLSPSQTLREVYLSPLSALMTRQQGKVFSGYSGIFYLMIDVKTDAVSTYRALRKQLLEFPVFQNNPFFRLFISGNRAVELILDDPENVAAVDGRLSDLYRQVKAACMPVISENFRQVFSWRGKGPMPAGEWQRLQTLAAEAHCSGKKLRFWSIPDQPNAWETLLNAGVDFINTDDLAGLQRFLIARAEGTPHGPGVPAK